MTPLFCHLPQPDRLQDPERRHLIEHRDSPQPDQRQDNSERRPWDSFLPIAGEQTILTGFPTTGCTVQLPASTAHVSSPNLIVNDSTVRRIGYSWDFDDHRQAWRE